MKLWQLHIPKTGGLALWDALDGQGHRLGHLTRLRQAPDPVITIVRDPVDRWVSAHDMCSRQFRHLPESARWPTADSFALDAEGMRWLEARFEHAFFPLVWWLETADYARERCWYICHTETLDADWEVVRRMIGSERSLPAIGQQHRNDHLQHGTPKSVLSSAAIAALREWYADDYLLLDGLR